ncbi:hypothetical protein D3C75_892420 [compost metagenome]
MSRDASSPFQNIVTISLAINGNDLSGREFDHFLLNLIVGHLFLSLRRQDVNHILSTDRLKDHSLIGFLNVQYVLIFDREWI